ncbi:nucleotidyltransferase family protein [Candidatus Dependentiae bacterium]
MKNGNQLTKEEILDFLRKNKEFFKKKFDVDKIMLFGSYARGDATPESDIDILIESKKKSFDKKFAMKVFLEKGLKKNVDLIYSDSVRRFIMRFIKEELIYA